MRQTLTPDSVHQQIEWPQGCRFAFTIFDDSDGQTYETARLAYSFLSELGIRTTIAVWPLGPRREANSGGETCANPQYLNFLKHLQKRGFEIAYHNATSHSVTRQETVRALDLFHKYFGGPPSSMANHYNQEAIYWGASRLTGWRRRLYNVVTLGQNSGKFFGQVDGHPSFWGDICREQIHYCRNFVYADINTLRACPSMPYNDPLRPYVRSWFCASEGHDASSFLNVIQESHQDSLEEQGGASIVYTHFGHGYVQDGQLHPEFRRLMERLVRKNGWFVPVSTLLDFLVQKKGTVVLGDRERGRLETRWLLEKLFRGTS